MRGHERFAAFGPRRVKSKKKDKCSAKVRQTEIVLSGEAFGGAGFEGPAALAGRIRSSHRGSGRRRFGAKKRPAARGGKKENEKRAEEKSTCEINIEKKGTRGTQTMHGGACETMRAGEKDGGTRAAYAAKARCRGGCERRCDSRSSMFRGTKRRNIDGSVQQREEQYGKHAMCCK